MAKPNQKNLDLYKTRIERAENYRDSGYRDKWERYYKRYRNVVDPLIDPETGREIKDRSNISIPYSFVMLETILPRMVETLFAARPYVTLKGRPKNAAEYRQYANAEEKPWDVAAEKMEKLLDYQHNVVFDIQDKFHIGLKIMGLYGTTVAYTGWKYEEKTTIRKEKMQVEYEGEPQYEDDGVTPVMDYQVVEEKETSYDDPELEFLDLGLFYVDPHATDIDDARYCGHNAYVTRDYIEKKVESGEWTVDWDKVQDEAKQNEARNRRRSIVGLPTTETDQNLQDDEQDLYEITYYHEDDKCVVLINRSWIAKEGPNPYWHKKKPYVKDVYTKVPGEFYGIGVIETIEDLQDELNTERNQRIDYRSMSMRRLFTQRRSANITPKNWSFKMFGRIIVDQHDDIQEVKVNPLPNDSFNQEETIKQDMRDATGAHDVVMGTSNSSETATTTMTKDNNASMRFKIVISSVEKRLLVGVTRLMIQMNQQFIDSERLIEVEDEDGGIEFMVLTPEDIQGQFRLIPSGSSVEPMANKEAHKQRMVELYNVAANDPLFQQFPEKRRNLLKKIFEAFDVKDVDSVLPTDEEMQGMQTQEVLAKILERLPPDLSNIVLQALQTPQQAPQPEMTPDAVQVGGGANTSLQQEQGMGV